MEESVQVVISRYLLRLGVAPLGRRRAVDRRVLTDAREAPVSLGHHGICRGRGRGRGAGG